MGQPLFEIKDLVRRHGVIAKSSNYTLYGDISRRVMELVSSCVPESSVYSIDEIFADLTGWPLPDLTSWARALKNRIYRETGIPVGIGISHTKTLAKLANRLAKNPIRLPASWSSIVRTGSIWHWIVRKPETSGASAVNMPVNWLFWAPTPPVSFGTCQMARCVN